MITSKPRTKPGRKTKRADEMEPEYRFDYSKAKPNRFAQSAAPGAVAVMLDADVAQVFQDAESVNAVLRALLNTMPRRLRRGK